MRWGKAQKKALAALFESKVADPEATKAADIDHVHTLGPEFEGIAIECFRENYKNCAREWMNAKMMDGVRRSECCFVLFFCSIPEDS